MNCANIWGPSDNYGRLHYQVFTRCPQFVVTCINPIYHLTFTSEWPYDQRKFYFPKANLFLGHPVEMEFSLSWVWCDSCIMKELQLFSSEFNQGFEISRAFFYIIISIDFWSCCSYNWRKANYASFNPDFTLGFVVFSNVIFKYFKTTYLFCKRSHIKCTL